ncbi:uncharacterized protein LOC143541736 [Bidens hawaiensis]|uniref:uncharacterized protein LOC143541736 n=1 Tax=Bidens hawaiensis TaxID=980011 RepID=UPI00404A4938
MAQVVEELEKALRLQGAEVTDVQIFGDSNGNGLAEVPAGEGDHEGDDNDETINSDITKEESKVVEETIGDTNLCESKDVERVPEDAETKTGDNLNDPECTEEVTVDLKSNEESKISVEDEVSNENSNGNGVPELSVGEDVQEGDDNGETVSSTITEEESKVTEETADDIARVSSSYLIITSIMN